IRFLKLHMKSAVPAIMHKRTGRASPPHPLFRANASNSSGRDGALRRPRRVSGAMLDVKVTPLAFVPPAKRGRGHRSAMSSTSGPLLKGFKCVCPDPLFYESHYLARLFASAKSGRELLPGRSD